MVLNTTITDELRLMIPWTSCQIRKIAGCACAGNAGNVFPRHRLQRKPLVSDPDMHHGTCVTHVPWCMSGSLTRSGGENVPGIPGACVTRNFTYLARGPWDIVSPGHQQRYHSIRMQTRHPVVKRTVLTTEMMQNGSIIFYFSWHENINLRNFVSLHHIIDGKPVNQKIKTVCEARWFYRLLLYCFGLITTNTCLDNILTSIRVSKFSILG